VAKKRPNKVEREYMNKVANYGCIACEIDGKISLAEVHHIRNHTGMGLRPPHSMILPLCASHHRTGKISVHLGKQAFEDRYGKQEDLAKRVRERIEEWDIITSIF
tara:strand:- start:1228 stop:1542 length:315 start_codon:yes stop_codon:yes gene_type:complete